MRRRDYRFRNAPRVVLIVFRKVLARITELISKYRSIPIQTPGQGLGVRIDEQLGGIASLTLLWVVGTVNAVAVKLAEFYARQIAMPGIPGAFAYRDDF